MKRQIFVMIVIGVSLIARVSHGAAAVPNDLYTVNGKNFDSKAQAIRYVVSLGKRVEVIHTRCEILTNKLTFKACPKNKLNSFENEQFAGLKVSE